MEENQRILKESTDAKEIMKAAFEIATKDGRLLEAYVVGMLAQAVASANERTNELKDILDRAYGELD